MAPALYARKWREPAFLAVGHTMRDTPAADSNARERSLVPPASPPQGDGHS